MKILTLNSSHQKQQTTKNKMTTSWLLKFFSRSRGSSLFYALLLLTTICSSVCFAANQAAETETETVVLDNSAILSEEPTNSKISSSSNIPSNHRSDHQEDTTRANNNNGRGRGGRQYDGSLTSAGTGSYASISGDGAYVGQMGGPSAAAAAAAYGSASSSPAANYANEMSGSYHSSLPSYHDPMSMARGYPHLGSMHPSAGYPGGLTSSMFSPAMGGGGGGGLMASSMFPLMSKGFDVSEIVCTAIAVAIGAVIVGAPFILIYLFVMNQMNGNSNMGPSGGAISLTGPNSNTNVSGRKKRQTSLPEALFKQLSPLVNSEQVASTFKSLMNSISKYQM